MRHPKKVWIDWTGAREVGPAVSTKPVEGDACYTEMPDHIEPSEHVMVVRFQDIFGTVNDGPLHKQTWFKWAYYAMAAEKSYAIEFKLGGPTVPAHQIQPTIDWVMEQLQQNNYSDWAV